MDEAKKGDLKFAQKRLDALVGFAILEDNDVIVELADNYLSILNMPKKCSVDCIHMATASVYNMDFMVSWNCKHIANANIKKKIQEINASFDIRTP